MAFRKVAEKANNYDCFGICHFSTMSLLSINFHLFQPERFSVLGRAGRPGNAGQGTETGRPASLKGLASFENKIGIWPKLRFLNSRQKRKAKRGALGDSMQQLEPLTALATVPSFGPCSCCAGWETPADNSASI